MTAFLNRIRDHIGGQGYRRKAQGDSGHDEKIATQEPKAGESEEQQIAADPVGWSYRQIARHAEQAQGEPDDDRVLTALKGLPPEQLAMLYEWLQQGVTCRQIALMKGISKEDAFARVADVLKALRDSLGSDAGGSGQL